MKKRIILTIAGLFLVVGIMGGIKFFQIRRMIGQASEFTPPPETVTTAEARTESWEVLLASVGSLAAVQGITVAAELPGKVVRIAFEPGAMVKKDALLVEQDTSSEKARLPGAEAVAALAKLDLERKRKLLSQGIIAQAEYDNAEARSRDAESQADEIRANIEKKTVRAAFSGRLGIRLVNLGQILKEGDQIVSLQALDPIFVNFSLPQQEAGRIRPGLTVRITNDALRDEAIQGKITAINPDVDPATRNIGVQATVPNNGERLLPGMYVDVAVVLPARDQVLIVPATSILYAPYGDSVYVVEEKESGPGGQPRNVLRHKFVRIGERRGDFVSVLSGVKEGETVVSTGAFKLRNGQTVIVDNTLAPAFRLDPRPSDE